MQLKSINSNINNILINSANLKKNEKCLILFSPKTSQIAKIFFKQVNLITTNCKKLMVNIENHGSEVNNKIKSEILKSNLTICLTWKSLAHSKARMLHCSKGGRFLSMPQLDNFILKSKACSINFKKYIKDSKKIYKKLLKGEHCIILTNNNKLYINLKKRIPNNANCFLTEGSLGSPPDIEVNIAPNENLSNGYIEVNGSISSEKIGILKYPILLKIEKGKITKILPKNKFMLNQVKKINSLLDSDKKKTIGELGFGLNPYAKLSGKMLLDEGCRGVVHLGFGSNYTIGGKNKVNFHLDFMIKNSDVLIDNDYLVKRGKLII